MSSSTRWFLIIVGVLAFVAIAFTILFTRFIGSSEGRLESLSGVSGDRIGLVEIKGAILSSEDAVRQIKRYREDSSILALLLRVDSPGGGVVASQEIYEEVRKTRDSGKPVVVSMGALAASGGYYVSCGASRIVANRGTLTGSIGVISEFLQAYEALDKIGIDFKTIKAGKLKDAGSPSRRMTAEDESYFQGVMDEVHMQFKAVVATERGLSEEEVREIADGRVFTGERAVELGLVDTIGTFEDAVMITADMAGIEGEPSIVKERKRRTWLDAMLGEVGETLTGVKEQFLQHPVMSYRYAAP